MAAAITTVPIGLTGGGQTVVQAPVVGTTQQTAGTTEALEQATGTSTITGGVTTFDTPTTLPTLTQSGGEVAGAARLTITGAFTWTGGSQTGTGETLLEGPATIGGPGVTLDTRTMTYAGPGGVLTGPLTLANGATVANTGTFSLPNDGDLLGTGLLTNSGSLTKAGAGTLTLIAPTVTNTGTIAVQSGTLALANGATNNGTIQILGGAALSLFNDGDILGTGAVANGGSLTKSGAGTTTVIQSSITNTGTVDIQSGTLQLSGGGAYTGPVTVATGASLELIGGIHELAAGGNVVGQPGAQVLLTNGTVRKTGAGSTNQLGSSVQVNSPGRVEVQSGTLQAFGMTTNAVTDVAAGGVLQIFSGMFNGTAQLTGGGSVEVQGPTIWNSAQYRLTGTLSVASGSLTINNDLVALGSGESLQPAGTMVTVSGGNLITVGATSDVVQLSSTGTLNAAGPVLAVSGGTATLAGTVANLTGSTLTTAAGVNLVSVTGGIVSLGAPLLVLASATSNATIGGDGLHLSGAGTTVTGHPGTGPLGGTGIVDVNGGLLSVGGDLIDVGVGATMNATTRIVRTLAGTVQAGRGLAVQGTLIGDPDALIDVGAVGSFSTVSHLAEVSGSLTTGRELLFLSSLSPTPVSIGGDLLHLIGSANFAGALSGGSPGNPAMVNVAGGTLTVTGEIAELESGATLTLNEALYLQSGGSATVGGGIRATAATLNVSTATPLVSVSGGATLNTGFALNLTNTNLNLGTQAVTALSGGSTLNAATGGPAAQLTGATLNARTLTAMTGATPNMINRTGPLFDLTNASVTLQSISELNVATDRISITLSPGQANIRMTDSNVTLTGAGQALSALGGLNVAPLTHAGVALVATNTGGAQETISLAGPLVLLTNGVTLTDSAPQIQLMSMTVTQTLTGAASYLIQVTPSIGPITLSNGSLFQAVNSSISTTDLTFGTITGTFALAGAPGSVVTGGAMTGAGTRAYIAHREVNAATGVVTGRLTVVDPATAAVVATVPLGTNVLVPTVVLSTDESRAYVVTRGGGPALGLGTSTVVVVATATNTVVATVPLAGTNISFSAVRTVAATPGRLAVLTTATDPVTLVTTGRVELLNQATNGVTALGLSGQGSALTTNPAQTRLYVSNVNATTLFGEVTVIDPAAGTIVATIGGLASTPSPVAVRGDGQRGYATVGASVTVLDLAANTVLMTVAAPVGGAPNTLVGEVVVNAAGTRAYVRESSFGQPTAGAVHVLDTATNTFIMAIAAGAQPSTAGGPQAPLTGLVVRPDGARGYALRTSLPGQLGGSAVSVLDLAANAVLTTVPVGGIAERLVLAPDGSQVYVLSGVFSPTVPGGTTGLVTILDTATNTVVGTVETSGTPGLLQAADGSRVALFGSASLPTLNVTGQVALLDAIKNGGLLHVQAGSTFVDTGTAALLRFNGGSATFSSEVVQVGDGIGPAASLSASGTFLELQNFTGTPANRLSFGSGIMNVLGGSTATVGRSLLDMTSTVLDLTFGPGAADDQPLLRMSQGSRLIVNAGPTIRMNGGSLTADALIKSDGLANRFTFTGTLLDLSNNASLTVRVLGDSPLGDTDVFTLNLAANQPFYQLANATLNVTAEDGGLCSGCGDFPSPFSGRVLSATNSMVTFGGNFLFTFEGGVASATTNTVPLVSLVNSTVNLNGLLGGANNRAPFNAHFVGTVGTVGGPLLSMNGASVLNITNGTLIEVNFGATLNIPGNRNIARFLDGASRINVTHALTCAGLCQALPNTAFLVKVTPGSTYQVLDPTFQPFVVADGTLDQEIRINNGVGDQILVLVDNGSTLRLGSTQTGVPLNVLAGTTVTENTNRTFTSALHEATGTLTGTGTVTVTGLYDWQGGAMSGAGITNANGGLTLTGNGNRTLTGARALIVGGTTTWSNGAAGTGQIIFNGGTLNSTGLWQDQNAFANAFVNSGGTNGFSNTGQYQKTGAGTTTINVPFVNTTDSFLGTALVDVQSGTLRLAGGGKNAALISVASSATLELSAGAFDWRGGNVDGAGSVVISGATVQAHDAVGLGADFQGVLRISAGSLSYTGEFQSNVPGTTLSLTGSAFVGTGGTTTVTEALILASTNAAGEGGVVVPAGGAPVLSATNGVYDLATTPGESAFRVTGVRTTNQAINLGATLGTVNLDLGTDRPLRGLTGPLSSSLVETAGTTTTIVVGPASGATRGKVIHVDTALLEATLPFLNFTTGTTLTVHATPAVIDLLNRAQMTSGAGVAAFRINASTVTVTVGDLIRVAGGSFLNVLGDLLRMSNGAILNLQDPTGYVLRVTGGSVVDVAGALVEFTGTISRVRSANAQAPDQVIGGIPFRFTGGATAAQVEVTSTPIRNPGLGAFETLAGGAFGGSLINVDGPGARVRVRGN